MNHQEQRSAGSSTINKRKTARNTLIIIGALIGVIAVIVGASYFFIASTIDGIRKVTVTAAPSLSRPPIVTAGPGKKAPINLLLLGSDSREQSNSSASAKDIKGFRSDTILAAQISADRQHLTMMSIMRDNWVEIQGVGQAKINAAVSYGGIPLAANTIENFTGIRFDHVALIDFEAFKGMTNAIGGVTVFNQIPFKATHGNFNFPQGEIKLNGEEALGFVRERYAFTDGDYQRARNQQAYLKGLTDKLLSEHTLNDAGKIISTFQALKPYLILDDGFNLNTAVSLGLDMRGLSSEGIRFFTSPTLGTATSADGQSIVLPDQAELDKVRAAFQAGTIYEYAATRSAGRELSSQ